MPRLYSDDHRLYADPSDILMMDLIEELHHQNEIMEKMNDSLRDLRSVVVGLKGI